MIFCDEPWYNEPGREATPNEVASTEYNMKTQTLTVPFALSSWLRSKHPIWQDVVDKHFSVHGEQILSVVKGWAAKEQEAHKSTITRPPPPNYFGPGANSSARLPSLAIEFENAFRDRGSVSKRKQPEPPSEEQAARTLASFNDDDW
jgi:hypothetical protein